MAGKKISKKKIQQDMTVSNLIENILALNEEIINLNKALSLSHEVINSLVTTVDILVERKEEIDSEDVLMFKVSNNTVTDAVYTVKKGDTLWSIAYDLLGDSTKWTEIYEYKDNKLTIGDNPDIIEVGQLLVIPPLDTKEGSN